MKLSQFKEILKKIKEINFELPNGTLIPEHFHITEVGEVCKKYIDCGGVLREDKTISFQLWHANDYTHRLTPEKAAIIFAKADEALELSDVELELEYQSDTIGKYQLDFNGRNFVLITKQTECLAEDACGIPDYQLPKKQTARQVVDVANIISNNLKQ